MHCRRLIAADTVLLRILRWCTLKQIESQQLRSIRCTCMFHGNCVLPASSFNCDNFYKGCGAQGSVQRLPLASSMLPRQEHVGNVHHLVDEQVVTLVQRLQTKRIAVSVDHRQVHVLRLNVVARFNFRIAVKAGALPLHAAFISRRSKEVSPLQLKELAFQRRWSYVHWTLVIVQQTMVDLVVHWNVDFCCVEAAVNECC